MAARLARAPISWREVAVAAVILAIVAGITWVLWARQPSTGARTQVSAKMLSLTYVPAYKSAQAAGVMEVEYADGRHGSIAMPYGRVYGCQPGDPVTVVSIPTNVGDPELRLAKGGCVS